MNKTTVCPVCDVSLPVHNDIEESEIFSCPECKSRLVVEKIDQNKVLLAKAPDVEEDWGE